MFHPNHWKTVCKLYRDILSEICEVDLLASILSEITGIKVELEKDSDCLGMHIEKSEYALS